MRRLIIGLALLALAWATPAAAQQATYTIFSTGTDTAFSGSVDARRSLPFGVNAAGYFDHDAIAREDVRLAASRPVYRGVLAVYEFRDHEGDAPNRFGLGYRLPYNVTAVVFPYGVDFDAGTVDDDGVTVQVNGSRKVGDWSARGVVDVTRRDGATRYFGIASASFDVAPGFAFVGEYRARTTDVGAVDRSVWFGLGVTLLR